MFHLHHLMLRIKDPKVSLPFYTEVLGMKLACTKKFDSFSLYFLGFLDEVPTFESNREADEFLFKNRGTFLELTHNHGTENDDSFKVSNGNEPGHQVRISVQLAGLFNHNIKPIHYLIFYKSYWIYHSYIFFHAKKTSLLLTPQGYGHIALTCPNVDDAVEKLLAHKVGSNRKTMTMAKFSNPPFDPCRLSSLNFPTMEWWRVLPSSLILTTTRSSSSPWLVLRAIYQIVLLCLVNFPGSPVKYLNSW